MSRLIDADALKKNYTNTFAEKYGVKGAEMFRDIVNQMPTAYDPEAVKKKIDRVGKSFCDYVACNEECTSCEHHSIMNAVTGIVRKGGAE